MQKTQFDKQRLMASSVYDQDVQLNFLRNTNDYRNTEKLQDL